MGELYLKTGAGSYEDVVPYVRTSSGWVRAQFLHRKTATTTWTQTVQYDRTPPAAPVITSFVQSGNKMNVTVKAPNDADTTRLRVKVTRNGSYGTSAASGTGWIAEGADGSDPSWSEWRVSPGQTRTKQIPLASVDKSVYRVAAYAVDKVRNVSAGATAALTYKAPPTTTTRVVTINPTQSATFRNQTVEWYYGDDYVRAGSDRNHTGAWFYNGRIKAPLANATEIVQARIKLQRVSALIANNIAETFRFQLIAHDHLKQTDSTRLWNPHVTGFWPEYHRMYHGQVLWITLPETWYAPMISGDIAGFGLYGPGVFSEGSLNTGALNGVKQLSGVVEITYKVKV